MSVFLNNLEQASALLKAGRLVAFPTETVYGLGADAGNSVAVAGIFKAKQRPSFDPLIVHIASFDQIRLVCSDLPDVARKLALAFWPGPLTLVIPRNDQISDLVTSGLPGVGVRVPSHPVALELLQLVGRPIAAPSANPFGRISPTTAQHVLQGLGESIDAIIDGGPCQVGVESTVVSCMGPIPVILRPGGCPKEAIEDVLGFSLEIAQPDPKADDAAQASPGMLSRHYAPRTPLILVDRLAVAYPLPGRKCGLLTEGTRHWSNGFDRIEQLSDTGDLRTCAARFFAGLRSLDSAALDVIIAHRFPEFDLGIALNDRLQRASAGSIAGEGGLQLQHSESMNWLPA